MSFADLAQSLLERKQQIDHVRVNEKAEEIAHAAGSLPAAARVAAKANAPHAVARKSTGMTPLLRTLCFLAVS